MILTNGQRALIANALQMAAQAYRMNAKTLRLRPIDARFGDSALEAQQFDKSAADAFALMKVIAYADQVEVWE